MKRLCLYTENYLYGGLERYLFDLLEHLGPEWDATLLHNDYPGFLDRLRAAVSRPVKTVALPLATRPLLLEGLKRFLPDLPARAAAKLGAPLLRRSFFERNRAAIGSALRREGPFDVLHIVNGGYPGAESCAAAAAAARQTVPLTLCSILSVHEPAYARRPDPEEERLLLSSVDLLVPNCEAGRRALLVHRGLPPEKVRAVHTGIPDPELDAARVARLKASWAPRGEKVVGCVGALYALKGHRHLLAAIPEILRSAPDTRFVLVGDGPAADELRAQAAALGVESALTFAGYYPGNAAEALAAFDVFVHPSCQTEGLPYAVLEAMALSKPVLAADVGGVGEAVVHGETGLLAPPGDPAALARGVLELLASPEKAVRLAAAGRQKQKREFSIERCVAETLGLYADGSLQRPAAK